MFVHLVPYITPTSLALVATAVLLVVVVLLDVAFVACTSADRPHGDAEGLKRPPSPRRLPVLGHLHLLAGHEVPYQAFTDLGRRFGNVVALQLGRVKCVVVNEQGNIKEALKCNAFDARPDFERYQKLFDGNKENSLAFCNWSDKQRNRREMLRAYTFPKIFSHKFKSLDRIISDSNAQFLPFLDTGRRPVDLKPLILKQCATVFTNHFCSRHFQPDDAKFARMIENFDEVFYEVNQGYAADFLPFLMPLHKNNLRRMNQATKEIRQFIEEEVIGSRFDDFSREDEPNDYIESLIQYVKNEDEPKLTWDTALFALEDILGGHSAVGNFLLKLFAYLVQEQQVQKEIQEEIDRVAGHREVTISDRGDMPYTEGAIFEAIRLIASPIVPRVATQDSSLDGYLIEKDTVIFLNNYDLSMSEELWDEPVKFKPERFVRDGHIFKPDHFLPFGGGKRSCMGYRMVQLVSFGVLAGMLQKYTIRPVPGENYKVPVGSLALPKDTFKFSFERR